MIACLDRINVGWAQLQMKQTLPFDDAVYGLGAGMFFVGYFLFGVPSNLLLEKIGARKTLLGIMMIWGVAATIPPRRVRGGLLSRCHSVFHLLVSAGAARSGNCDLHVGYHYHRGDRGTAMRCHSEIFQWLRRSPWLAMAVHRAGIAGDCSRLPCISPSGGQACQCRLALA
jgi:MFS family permease